MISAMATMFKPTYIAFLISFLEVVEVKSSYHHLHIISLVRFTVTSALLGFLQENFYHQKSVPRLRAPHFVLIQKANLAQKHFLL